MATRIEAIVVRMSQIRCISSFHNRAPNLIAGYRRLPPTDLERLNFHSYLLQNLQVLLHFLS